jgi:hypothetical protein
MARQLLWQGLRSSYMATRQIGERRIEVNGQPVTVRVFAPYAPRVRVPKVPHDDLAFERIAEARAEAAHMGLGALTSYYRDGDEIVLF